MIIDLEATLVLLRDLANSAEFCFDHVHVRKSELVAVLDEIERLRGKCKTQLEMIAAFGRVDR
jgi:hypothetical protein